MLGADAATAGGYALLAVDALELLAETAVRRGDDVRSGRLFGAADGHRRLVPPRAEEAPEAYPGVSLPLRGRGQTSRSLWARLDIATSRGF